MGNSRVPPTLTLTLTLTLTSGCAEMWWLITALLVVLGTIMWWRRSGGPLGAKRPSGPQALIVLPAQGYPAGSVVAAITAFRLAGLEVVMATRDGAPANPEPESLKTKEGVAAEKREDPVWLWVLRTAQKRLRPLSSCKPDQFVAIFVVGGPAMLQELMQHELSGRTPTPFRR